MITKTSKLLNKASPNVFSIWFYFHRQKIYKHYLGTNWSTLLLYQRDNIYNFVVAQRTSKNCILVVFSTGNNVTCRSVKSAIYCINEFFKNIVSYE